VSKRGNNEGSLTHRKDGRWEASVSLGGGKRRRFYAATRQEASRKLNEALRARADRLPLLTDRLTVGAYLSNWLVGVKPTLRPGTWERYRQYVELHAIPVIGGIPLVRLAPEHLEKLYADRLEAGLSPTTVGHLHAVCHRAFGEAARRGQMLRNPVDLVKRPRATRREMMALSPEQARAFLDAARGDRYEGLYVLALTSGARQGELLALRWDAVNLDAATLTVRATLRRTRDGFVFGEPKTARSRRQIALTAVAVAALRRHRARQLAERLAQPYWQDETLVFGQRSWNAAGSDEPHTAVLQAAT